MDGYIDNVTMFHRLREAYCQCKSGSEQETLISSLKACQNRYSPLLQCYINLRLVCVQESWEEHWQDIMWFILGTLRRR